MIFPYDGWRDFSFLFSAEASQNLLKKCYRNLQVDNHDQKSYENCYPFMYYLEHGKIYYEQASAAPLMIQPILVFYGYVHLIKACILTTAPDYPESTSVLAHGVSTRKRKKQNYSFFEDEVKFQKSGLFPLMAEKLFNIKQLEGEKAIMGDLYKYIPELNTLFQKLEAQETFIPVEFVGGTFSVPTIILDHFHMTENRFKEFYKSKSYSTVTFLDSDNDPLNFEVKANHYSDLIPLKFDFEKKQYVMPLTKGDLVSFPEILIHYLLLYNLSMIARYETEWWSELIKMMPNKDYPFIYSFLNSSLRKGPFLIYDYLMSIK